MTKMAFGEWHRLDVDLEMGEATTVVVADRAVCVTRTERGYGALDNHCPHQGLSLIHISEPTRR